MYYDCRCAEVLELIPVLGSQPPGDVSRKPSDRLPLLIAASLFNKLTYLLLTYLYSITEHRVSELIPVLGSQPASDVSHKPGGRLPLLSARPTVTLATL